MYYTVTTPTAAVTMPMSDRRALHRAICAADKSIMRDVHIALQSLIAADSGKSSDGLRRACNRIGKALIAKAVQVYPSVIVDGATYAPGIIRAALTVAHVSVKNAVRHNPGNMSLRSVLHGLDGMCGYMYRADNSGATWEESAENLYAWLAGGRAELRQVATVKRKAAKIVKAVKRRAAPRKSAKRSITYKLDTTIVLPGINTDAQNLHSEAVTAIYEAVADGCTQRDAINRAYQAVNRWIMAGRAANVREVNTEYLLSDGGDLVETGTAIATVLHGGDRYIPVSDAVTYCRIDSVRLFAALRDVFQTLTNTQLDIIRRLVNGQTVAEITEKTGRKNIATVTRHIDLARGKMAEYLQEHYPDVLPMVNGDGYKQFQQEMRAARSDNRRSEKGKAARKNTDSRRTEEGKARAAACKKAYRERKKAEKAAQAAVGV